MDRAREDKPKFEWMSDTARQAYEAIGNSFGRAGEKAQQAGSEAQQARDKGAKRANQMGDEAYRKGQKAYDEASRRAADAKERVYEQGEAAGERGRQMGQQAQQKARGAGEQAADYGRQAYENAQQAGGQAADYGRQAQQKARGAGEQAADYGRQAYDNAQQAGEHAYRQVADSAEYGYDRAAENAQYAGDKIREAVSDAYEKVGQAGSKAAEPFEYATEGAKSSWSTLTDRVRQWLPGSQEWQQARGRVSLESHTRAMFDHAIEETKKFWKSVPPFDPATMDPAKYVGDFQREMAYHYGTMAAVPRVQVMEVRTVAQHDDVGKQVVAPASMLFLPLLALLAAWIGRRVHVRRRGIQEQHRSHEQQQHRGASEKQGTVVHQGAMTPSTAMDTNYEIMTALSTSLYAASSITPLVATLVALLEFNGVSVFLVVPVYLMLLMGSVMHLGEAIREGASRELPGGSGRERFQRQRSPDIMGLSPGEWLIVAALSTGGAMAGYTILWRKPFSMWPF